MNDRDLRKTIEEYAQEINRLRWDLERAHREIEEIRDSKLTIKEILEDHGDHLVSKPILRTYVGTPNGITVIIAK